MGTDDLFRKRKARKEAGLERKKAARMQNKRYLIVCEGTKTEPNYLNELVADFGIRLPSVRVEPSDGSSPDRVVGHGIARYEQEAKTGDSFDAVFFVFDRDHATTYNAAVLRVSKGATAGNPFKAVTSVPCFEYWLLLHFGYTNRPFERAGNKSACDSLVKLLRSKPSFKNYGKGNKGTFQLLRDKLPVAMAAAARGLKTAIDTGEENPSTRMHELVQALQSLADEQSRSFS